MKKQVIYALATTIPALILMSLAQFLWKQDLDYVIWYGALCTIACYLICSCTWHTVKKSWTVKVVCSKVWLAIAEGFVLGCILTSSFDWFTAYVGMIAVGLVNWAGFRWISGDDSVVFAESKVQKLADSLLFELDQDGNANHMRPLCMVNGAPVTPTKARELGYVEMADSAIAYIRTLI